MNLIAIASLAFTLIMAGFNAAMFLVIKFNDMKHLSQDMKELKILIDKIDNKIDSQGQRISTIEGTCKANHKL